MISEFVSKCTCCSNTVNEFCSAVFLSWGGGAGGFYELLTECNVVRIGLGL